MALVDRALDEPKSARSAILDECTDEAVRALARRFLDADDRAGAFLDAPAKADLAVRELARATATDAGTEGERVGPFRLVSILGRGGMGEVWIAERVDADFDQRVALKLLPVADEASAARFRRERRILARLSHPRIAKLLDVGVAADGRPWLAMELAEGLHLIAHCTQFELDVDARLRLFGAICDAVQYAHRNLVVHRDLKPSNIVVGDDGAPKLLDFGIAKLLEEDTGDPLTRTEERPMTLEYAAPEQIRGDEVTTASDVWTLGVILHELLTGVRPFGAGKKRIETEKAILDAVPTRPSGRIDDTSATRPPGPARALRSKLRGDLDAIVLKALRAEPSDRYPSAEALGADVKRHLDRAPVSARGDATGYLVRAMMRRHRAAFLLSGVALAVLLIGLASTLWEAHRAREEARKAERAQDFLVSMLRAFDPNEARGAPITQPQILERGEGRVDELADQPEVQARLLLAFAQTWYDLGEFTHSRTSGARALAIERTLGVRDLELVRTLEILGSADFELGDFTSAGVEFDEALTRARELEGPRGLTVALLLNDVAGLKRRLTDFASAESLRREALAIFTSAKGERDPETLAVENDLGVLLTDEGRFRESADLLERTCKLMTEVRGGAQPETLVCKTNLARDDIEMGSPADAQTILAAVYADSVRVLGSDWTELAHTARMSGRALDALGRGDEALAAFADAKAREAKLLTPDDPDHAPTLMFESLALVHASRFVEAEASARAALAICVRRLGESHACSGRSHIAIGTALLAQGDRSGAKAELARGLAIEEKTLGDAHFETIRVRAQLNALGSP